MSVELILNTVKFILTDNILIFSYSLKGPNGNWSKLNLTLTDAVLIYFNEEADSAKCVKVKKIKAVWNLYEYYSDHQLLCIRHLDLLEISQLKQGDAEEFENSSASEVKKEEL